LALGILENALSAKITLVEAGNFEYTDEDKKTGNYDDLLASIGELFATLMNCDGLKEDTKTLDIQFGNR
jgi:hypothetical protein